MFVCFERSPSSRRGYGRGPLYEVPVSHSPSKVGIHPPPVAKTGGHTYSALGTEPKVSGNGVPPSSDLSLQCWSGVVNYQAHQCMLSTIKEESRFIVVTLYIQKMAPKRLKCRGLIGLFVCLFGKEPLFKRGYGRGPLYEVPVSHSSSKVGIHPSL